MLRLTAAIALPSIAPPAFAHHQEEPKPNTLTPKEIADGWLLLFDGETAFGWKIEGDAKVDGGWLGVGGGRARRATTTSSLPDCEIRFDYKEGSEKVILQVATGKDSLPPSKP